MATRETVQVVDLFSGCGGMSYGFHSARTQHVRYRVLGGLDIDKHANSTYERMMQRPALFQDVRELTDRHQLSTALEKWEYDADKPLLLIGCAPWLCCANAEVIHLVNPAW